MTTRELLARQLTRARDRLIVCGFDSKCVAGEIPSRSAVASTNGLNEEPG